MGTPLTPRQTRYAVLIMLVFTLVMGVGTWYFTGAIDRFNQSALALQSEPEQMTEKTSELRKKTDGLQWTIAQLERSVQKLGEAVAKLLPGK